MDKLKNVSEADYRAYRHPSFTQLFQPVVGSSPAFIKEVWEGRHPKCLKGLSKSQIVQSVMQGEKNLVYLSTISLLKPDTDPMDADGFEFEYKCRIDYVNGTTGAFIVATKATDGKQFINACVKRNLYEKALLAILASDIQICLLIGVSSTKRGRVFVTVMHKGSEKVGETMKNIREAAYGKGYRKQTSLSPN